MILLRDFALKVGVSTWQGELLLAAELLRLGDKL
jgi:hypothetical protein